MIGFDGKPQAISTLAIVNHEIMSTVRQHWRNTRRILKSFDLMGWICPMTMDSRGKIEQYRQIGGTQFVGESRIECRLLYFRYGISVERIEHKSKSPWPLLWLFYLTTTSLNCPRSYEHHSQWGLTWCSAFRPTSPIQGLLQFHIIFLDHHRSRRYIMDGHRYGKLIIAQFSRKLGSTITNLLKTISLVSQSRSSAAPYVNQLRASTRALALNSRPSCTLSLIDCIQSTHI
jgi:hypothetical protein